MRRIYFYAFILLAIIGSFTCAAMEDADEPANADQPAGARVLMKINHETLEHLGSVSGHYPEKRLQFNETISDEPFTIAQITDKLKQWAAMQGAQVQALYEYARDRFGSIFANETIANSSLSAAAKQAFVDIASITANSDETMSEKAAQLKSFIESLTEEVRNEMVTYVKSNVRNALEELKEKPQLM